MEKLRPLHENRAEYAVLYQIVTVSLKYHVRPSGCFLALGLLKIIPLTPYDKNFSVITVM